MSERDYALGELDRRMGNVVRFGTVAEVDAANALAKVDLGDLVTDWLPWSTSSAGDDRVWNTPDVGQQVIVASSGEPSQGVIIGSLFRNASPANGNNGKDRRITFKDGTVVEFDRTGSVLNIDVNAAGSIRLNIGGTTLLLQDGQATLTTPKLVVDSPDSTFTGAVKVQGLLTYQAGITGSGGSGASLNGPFNLVGNFSSTGTLQNNGKNVGSTHTHSGVQAGGSTTGAPV